VPEVAVELKVRHLMHERFMREALAEAEEAERAGEVPVGAVVVAGGDVIGRGRNQPIGTHDPTAHAEIVALRAAARHTGNYRLTDATLYVTVEPCLMCVGALVHARIGALVFGAPEPKAGAVESTQRAHEHVALNHRLVVVSGVLAKESRDLLKRFFAERRKGD
jgi:tRNA(Arg) A34 adenosine deaminase TadA